MSDYKDFSDISKEGHQSSESGSPSNPQIRREIDSLDDFEHLSHDSFPLHESAKDEIVSDLKTELPRDVSEAIINTGVGKVAAAAANAADAITDELSSFDPLKSSLFDKPVMDSNLLGMGEKIPDRKEGGDKLDKFLDDISFAPSKHQEPPEIKDKDDFKSATQDFVQSERQFIQAKKLSSSNDQLEKYSDSEPDNDDDFKPSKYEDFPKKNELPESFKDVEEFDVHFPKKDYPIIENVKEKAPEPIKEKIPEPVKKPEPIKEKTPESVKKPIETKDNTPTQPPKTAKTDDNIVKQKKVVTEAEAIFCKMGLDAWFNPDRLNPKVESLIYWREPKKSGPVFGGVLLVLLALTYVSLISVVAYLSLFVLTGTIAFRIYKNVVQAVQKTGDGHPFKEYLECDVALPQNKVKEISEVAVAHLNAGIVELRRLFLVEDLVDSIKFGVLLWSLTYLGAWFNGMTLIIIAWVALFTLPKVYEANKTQIDANLEIVRTKLADITSKVKAAIPIGKKAEEKKEQ